MKTQSLLLTAAAVCLGATSAFGAVSSNIVGYTKLSLNSGLNLIANTLDNKNGNKVADVIPTILDSTTIFQFNGAGYTSTQFLADDPDHPEQGGSWTAAATLTPGNGFFIQLSAATSVTFVGEVLQGALSNPVPKGLSIKSSQVPQAGGLDTLGLVPGDSDTVFVFKGAAGYDGFQFLADDPDHPEQGGSWQGTPDGKAPSIAVGQAVFYSSTGSTTWNRNFTVN